MAKRKYKLADHYTAEASRMTENGAVKTGKKNTYVWIGKNVHRNLKGKLLKKKSAGGKGG